MAKAKVSKTDGVFKPALLGKRIPLLTLDHKWHQLFTQVAKPDQNIIRLENELNELLKRQGRAKSETEKIKALKRQLMNEIVEHADEFSTGNDQKAQKKAEENTRLIGECNEKLEDYEDELLELPKEIDRVNKELMLRTMEICYDKIQNNEAEIKEATEWVARTRVELKERLVKKQEQETMNQELYSYMHDIFGAEVIEIFDMNFQKEDK